MVAISKALIVYGTRFGAAASTSEEIAKIFRQQGLETEVVDAKKAKIKDITPYSLVVVGSGIQVNRWTGEPEDFVKKFRKELVSKKVALFVCCGSASLDKSNRTDEANEMKEKYLNKKAVQLGLQPVALGFFGGVVNYNKTPWWAKRAMEVDRSRVESTFKPVEPGVYDLRDWDAIKSWATELVQKTVNV